MINSILFDLDDTLIDNPMDAFIPAYFSALMKKVAALVQPHKFIDQLRKSTRAMVKNTNPALTNEQVFAADFFSKLGVPREPLMLLFDDFYAREYRDLRAYVQSIDGAEGVVARAFERNRRVVIATNPLFPRTAIVQRIEWGKLDRFDYALVTDYETMHATKPNPAYYREIAARLGVKPSECVMVGNDVGNDISPARKVGMKTFWITDAGALPTNVASDWRGTLEDFGDLLTSGELQTN
jgi:HAD superfamily hydrolase (TIGR01549 family)